MQAIAEFVEQRDAVIKYIRDTMKAQGADSMKSSMATAGINFWSSRDVENLYKCINSDLPERVKLTIVAHDFNGLAYNAKHFMPKSRQFEEQI